MRGFFARIFAWDRQATVATLYGAVMAQSRAPFFYNEGDGLGVPDTFENRFEFLVLHMYLFLQRLKTEGQAGLALGQQLVEFMVSDLDRTCREMGIGDVGVVKRMKTFMENFYGRLKAYEQAEASDDEKDLLRSLDKNLLASLSTDRDKLEAMRRYMHAQKAHLAALSFAVLQKGELSFSNKDHLIAS